MNTELTLIPGGVHIDDRGSLRYFTGFDPDDYGIRRFYIVSNHSAGFIRAWHAHRHESKWITCISGTAIVAVAKVDDPLNPDPCEEVQRFVLSGSKPDLLYVPPGYANGWKSLSGDCSLLVMSDKTVGESLDDDYRIPWDFWDPWKVEQR